MARVPQMRVVALLFLCAGFAGCRTHSLLGGSPGSGNSSVVLAMTDLPPSNVSILAAKVTLTGATLNPGNVSLFSGTAIVELTKLQTDIAYIATATNIPAGTYTSLTLTFANPLITIENDTTSMISGCAVGSICTITIPSPSVMNPSPTIPLTGFTTIAGASAGLLVDVSLDNLLSATLGADFQAGTTVAAFTPGGAGAPLVGAEDVVGQAVSVTPSSDTFTLQNVTGSFSLKVDGATTFFQFPSSTCSFSCLQNNQILSVDIGIQADGSLLAKNIVLEDVDSSDTEVEGMITSTNAASQEFNIVVLAISATGTGLNIGDAKTVQYSMSTLSPTTFDLDFLHADGAPVSTTTFKFAGPTDFAQAGQQVSIRRNSSSTTDIIKADRVRLRSSRTTATVSSIGSPFISLFRLPSLFFGHGGVTIIQVQTTSAILEENNKSIFLTNIPPFGIVSVRGPLFNTGTTTQNLVASKVVLKP